MSNTTKNRIREQISAIEGAQAILIKAVNTDGMEGKSLIESAIYIIEHAVPAVRKQLSRPVAVKSCAG